MKKTELKAKLVSFVFIVLMPVFHERKETPDKIIIRYKYWPLFYIILVGCLILSITLDEIVGGLWGYSVWGLVFIFLLIFIIDHWKPWKETRKAMREGSVKISGSKFSFSNPFVVVIKKGRK